MELAQLGFYKKKNGFEGPQDVLDFYNKVFRKTPPMEIEVILPHASAEGVDPQGMSPFAVEEVFDPQEAEERSITIVKPKKSSTEAQVSALTQHKPRRSQPKFRNPLR
jgi:hypothetical protein